MLVAETDVLKFSYTQKEEIIQRAKSEASIVLPKMSEGS